MQKPEFPKDKCRRAFADKGEDAMLKLGRELKLSESKLKRWVVEFGSGKPAREKSPTTTSKRTPQPSSVDFHKEQVEIFPDEKKKNKVKMLGSVLRRGPEQSVVFIYAGPESLIGHTQTFINKDLKTIQPAKSKQGW